MTQEIFGTHWQDDVVAIAVENADIDLNTGDTVTLIVRAVFGGNVASQRKDNSNFTFAIEDGDSVSVGANTGVISTVKAGTTHISITLKNSSGVATDKVAIATVTVS